MKRRELRKIILNCLYQYQLLDLDPDTLFENNLNYDLPKRFANEQTNPVIKPEGPNDCDYDFDSKDEINYVIQVVSNAINNLDAYAQHVNSRLHGWTFDRLGYVERAILLMAYSEKDLQTAPEHTIIDEAVDLAKEYCDDDAYALINGVLDEHE